MNFLNLIERKRDGNDLSADEVAGLVEQFTADQIPDYQMAAFLMAVRLMKRTGIGFADILKAGPESADAPHNEADLRLYRSIEIEMMSLKNRLTRLQGKLAMQDGELKRYRAAFNELMEASWSLQGREGQPDGQPVYN